MPIVLAFNPGSNSLKFDIVDAQIGQPCAGDGRKLFTGAIDNIGKETTAELSRITNNGTEQLVSKEIDCKDFVAATEAIYTLLEDPSLSKSGSLPSIDLNAIRVVHGGDDFTAAVRFDKQVRAAIEKRQRLAPLHNANSLRIAEGAQKHAPNIPIAVAFDTAFHHTIPEHAWRYPLPRELADKHGIRKFGFHGISHRYMLERYAQLAGRPVAEVSAVTLHLESGSSACAIQNGKSVDTSMGFTPLEGLMMGTRSGSIDPAILPFLMEEEHLSAADALNILEKKSGLQGVSGITLDTRILRKRKEASAKQAIDIFAYKVRQSVGAYLAVLGKAEVVIFSGGIGENTPEVRNNVLEGLAGWGFVVDPENNAKTMGGDVKISHSSSPLAAWVLHSEEGMQIAHETVQTL
jgi:acetate kinase